MRKVKLGLLIAGVAGTLYATPAPAAEAGSWSCRASAARVTLPEGLGDVEPVRANDRSTPCTPQSASVVSGAELGPVAARAVGAFTYREGTGPGSALASVSSATVALPGLEVGVTAAEATATGTCTGSTPGVTGTSRVAGLTINGNEIVVPPGDAPVEIPAGVATVSLNKEVVDGTTLTRRAIEIATPVVTIVIAEAIAGHAAGACTADAGGSGPGGNGGGSGGGTGTGPNPCPSGATYDVARNLCVIREGATVIVVGRPFEGPSGGTVLSLAEARKRYRSLCLSGSGPRYAIVGTSRNDTITGTNRKDRILLLAGRDKAEGGRGNDCIDGGTGGDTMSGALGADRIVGGRGHDHLVGGSHADNLSGGAGNDTIHSGFGKDRINGGTGGDRINAATAGPASRSIRCGSGRDKIRVNGNEARRARARTSRCETVYVIR